MIMHDDLKIPSIIGDSYKTPENLRRYFLDRLFHPSGFVFYLKYLGIVLRQRRLAVRNKYDDRAYVKSSQDIFRLIEKCGGKFNITGVANLRECKGPVVFVSNHMGTLETMIFPMIIAPLMKVTFVVKDSLVRNKLFGPIMRSQNPITVSRKNSRDDLVKVMEEGKKLLEKGRSIIIFPQSTRQVDFNPDKFNTLGYKLASKSGARLIPVAVKTDFWGNGKKIKELGPINRELPIYMDFGRALDIDELGKEAHSLTIDHIKKNLSVWK